MKVLLAISCLMLLNLNAHAQKQVHVLRAGANLEEAVNMAMPGDTLLLQAGLYFAHGLTIRKPLTIMGQGRPVIDGQNKGNILIISSDSVRVIGLELQNTGRSNIDDPAAIKFFDAKHCHVEDNVLINTFFGIHFSNSRNNTIKNNHLVSEAEREYMTGNGIHLWKCKDNIITGNYVKGHRDGIYLEFVTHTKSEKNVVEYNKRYGLHFMFSHENAYLHNTFRSNGAGVAVMYTRHVEMKYNLFTENQGASSYGMLLKDISDSDIRFNRFEKNTVGIYMEGSSRNVFEKNIFRENGSAIKLMASCDDNNFRFNNFIGNSFDISTNGSVVLNTLKQNYWDKYEGYDLDRDGLGDVPYRPISLYGTIIERMPAGVVLWRSFLVTLLDRAEKILPAITPENMKDVQPSMKAHDIYL